jgi:hypothetical protein
VGAGPTSCWATINPRSPPPPVDAAGWLNTDLARCDPDGTLSVGRQKLIIRSGFNVIRQSRPCSTHPSILHSAVVGLENEGSGRLLDFAPGSARSAELALPRAPLAPTSSLPRYASSMRCRWLRPVLKHRLAESAMRVPAASA